MTPDEMYDFKSEGMVTHPEEPGRVTCSIHCGNGQVYKQSQKFAVVAMALLGAQGSQAYIRQSRRDGAGASHRMKGATMATGVRSKAPAVQIASVGEASQSSSQRAIPIPATTLGTVIVALRRLIPQGTYRRISLILFSHLQTCGHSRERWTGLGGKCPRH